MMYATKIRMNSSCQNSSYLTDIDAIFLEGDNANEFYKKDVLYDHLKKHPDSLKVKIYPYPYIVPALSSKGEKYVRSEPDDSANDNLLKLPRV